MLVALFIRFTAVLQEFIRFCLESLLGKTERLLNSPDGSGILFLFSFKKEKDRANSRTDVKQIEEESAPGKIILA